MKLLVVDDEARIRELIKKYATFEQYDVTEAENGMQAVELCRQAGFRPHCHGRDDAGAGRLLCVPGNSEDQRRLPVLDAFSARGEEYDKIHGFELGIDDYVVKPFSPKELMMRVGAILKRSGGRECKAARWCDYRRPDAWTSPAGWSRWTGKPVDLSPKEYDLFFYLVQQPRHCADPGKADH